MGIKDLGNHVPEKSRVFIVLREAEIEKQYHPEAISADESNKMMQDIFKHWGISYTEA